MKHLLKSPVLLILLTTCLVFSSISISAQQFSKAKDSLYRARLGREKPIKAIFKTSPLAIFEWQIPLTGEYRLVGEFMLGKRSSVQLGASYLTRSLFFSLSQKMAQNSGGGDKISGNGYRIQGEYKFYFFNKKYRPEGLFLALHSSFASVKYNFKGYPDDYQLLQHFNINLLIGGQLIIRNRVSIEVFIGPGYKNNHYIDQARTGYGVFSFDDLNPMLKKHFKLSTGLNIGITL
jgi:hypothetical protein